MQNLLETNEFIAATKAGEIKLGTNFAKGFAAFFLSAFLAINPSQKVMASAAEHQAVLNLVPTNEANRLVAQNGSWSNPATWGGVLPTAGDNIYVPEGKTLVVDVASDISLGTLRVDGILKFATNTNIRLKLDTLVVTPTGTIEIGAEYARVPNSKKIEIIIANNGPIDRVWDPSNISRGVILQGKTRIYGSNKSAYHEIAIDPAAGSTQITLATTPVGWMKGDIIAITATKFRPKKSTDTSYQTEDELRRINAISGKVITLGRVENSNLVEPLQYSHVPSIANMPVYAANLTRNVVFSGEGGDAVPASQRGHFMVMHAPNTIIKGAGFYHLGRTDKSFPLNDFKLDANDNRLTDAQGNYIPDVNTNPRGRYAVHFHHTGVDDPNAQPVICSGNAIISSPGWGFVNHSSNVTMQNNASYNVLGSHFVTEDGNELGAFIHNIAIKSSGRAGNGWPSHFKFGMGNHDHGHSGHGFWFQNRNIKVEDNVVSGTFGAGFMYYARNVIKGINLNIPKDNLIYPDKSIVKGGESIVFINIPILAKNLTVLASDTALMVVKPHHNQGHDGRSVIESVKGYSVLNGANIEYTAKYDLKDFEIVADPLSRQWNYGINISRNVRDIVISGTKVDGFVHPFETGTFFRNEADQTDAIFINTLVNGKLVNLQTDIHKPQLAVESNYDPAFHQAFDVMPETKPVTLTLSENNSYNLPARLSDGFKVTGVKSDTLGEKVFESTWDRAEQILAILKKGYYTRPDGSKFIILSEPVYDRISGETITMSFQANIVTNYGMFMGPNLGMAQ